MVRPQKLNCCIGVSDVLIKLELTQDLEKERKEKRRNKIKQLKAVLLEN